MERSKIQKLNIEFFKQEKLLENPRNEKKRRKKNLCFIMAKKIFPKDNL